MNKKEMDLICETLQGIAMKYDHGSSEYKTVELATKGLLYIYVNDQFDGFLQEIAEWGKIEE